MLLLHSLFSLCGKGGAVTQAVIKSFHESEEKERRLVWDGGGRHAASFFCDRIRDSGTDN